MTLLLSFQFVLVLISDPYLNPTLINRLKEINSSTSAFLPDSLCICELKGTNCSSSRMAQGKVNLKRGKHIVTGESEQSDFSELLGVYYS